MHLACFVQQLCYVPCSRIGLPHKSASSVTIMQSKSTRCTWIPTVGKITKWSYWKDCTIPVITKNITMKLYCGYNCKYMVMVIHDRKPNNLMNTVSRLANGWQYSRLIQTQVWCYPPPKKSRFIKFIHPEREKLEHIVFYIPKEWSCTFSHEDKLHNLAKEIRILLQSQDIYGTLRISQTKPYKHRHNC